MSKPTKAALRKIVKQNTVELEGLARREVELAEVRSIHALNAQLGEVDAKAALEGAEHEMQDIDRGRQRLTNASDGALRSIASIEATERTADMERRHAEATTLNAERVSEARKADTLVAELVAVLKQLAIIDAKTKGLVPLRTRITMLETELVQAFIHHGMNKLIALPRPARGKSANEYRSFERYHEDACGWVRGACKAEVEESGGAGGQDERKAA